MPRLRKKDKHLPPRVYFKHGRYWYVDLNNKWHNLGAVFHEAMAAWTKLVNRPTFCHTMTQLFNRYMIEVAPKKAERTYKDNIRQMQYLREFFGRMYIEDVTPVDIYRFLDTRVLAGVVVQANREKALLSHC